MSWLSLSLIALIVSLLLTLLFLDRPKLWPRVRPVSILSFEISGVLFVALILVTLTQLATTPGQSSGQASLALTWQAAQNSLVLMAAATAWGTLAGLGLAFVLTLRQVRLDILGLVAALLWVLPTFLLAIIAQEIQADIYNATNLAVSGGYAHVSPLLIAWAALVLGIRPGAYVFRRARVVLSEGSREDFVRTANAKGMDRFQVVSRHILRPSLPILITAWLISFRLLVGSLPLVEYFFGYPGLGNLFVSSFGIGGGSINADQAIATVAVLASLFLILEAVASQLQQRIDPRLTDVRTQAETAR